MPKPLRLTDMEIDALKEMGNIGTGNAATALSRLLDKNVDIYLPEIDLIPVGKFADTVGGPEKIVVGIYLQIRGEINGECMFLFPEEGAYEMIDLLLGAPKGTTKAMNEVEESAFKELANILTGAFLNSLANMLEAKILPSIPHVANDMAQTVLDFLLIKISQSADNLLFIKTKINVQGHKTDGEFIVLFDSDSLQRMLKKLHDKYDPDNILDSMNKQ